jgi:hypothetical protein
MTLAIEEDVAPDPRHVRLLRATAVVAGSNGVADSIQETGLRILAGRGFPDRERCVSCGRHAANPHSRHYIKRDDLPKISVRGVLNSIDSARRPPAGSSCSRSPRSPARPARRGDTSRGECDPARRERAGGAAVRKMERPAGVAPAALKGGRLIDRRGRTAGHQQDAHDRRAPPGEDVHGAHGPLRAGAWGAAARSSGRWARDRARGSASSGRA